MNLVLRDGITYWRYDDGLELPIIAGGDGGGSLADAWANQYGGSGGSESTTKPPPTLIGGTIVTPDGTMYKVRSGSTSGKGPYYLIGPDGTAQPLEAGLYATPIGRIVNIKSNGEIIEERQMTQSEREAYGLALPGGTELGGGGGGGGPTAYGYAAPDPYNAAALLMKEYEYKIAAGQLTTEEAAAAWERQFKQLQEEAEINSANITNKLQADITGAGLTRDYAQMEQDRAANMATAMQNLRDTATRRADVFASQILPNALPVGYQLNLGMGGLVPENRVDVDAMFNQGLPSLAESYGGLDTLFPAVGPAPTVTAGEIPMPNFGALPEVPRTVMPAFPDISPYVNATAAGSPGWII
jgi:hypothetical protein